jgi:hypothetical protein
MFLETYVGLSVINKRKWLDFPKFESSLALQFGLELTFLNFVIPLPLKNVLF